MLNEPPGSKEIQILIDALRTQAGFVRSRGEAETAEYFEKVASTLVIGPAGEIPLQTFSTDINHPKGLIDEMPSGISRSEWTGVIRSIQKLTNSALTSSGWSPGILSLLKKALWPF